MQWPNILMKIPWIRYEDVQSLSDEDGVEPWCACDLGHVMEADDDGAETKETLGLVK